MSKAAQMESFCSQHDELIKCIKELNQTRNAVLSAINNLSNKVNDLNISSHGQKSCSDSSLTLVPTPNAVAVVSSDQPTREFGYVNWNSTHDVLKSQKWVRVQTFTSYCGTKERTPENQYYKIGTANTYSGFTLNENNRFLDGLFVNVNNPQVAAEILYISEIRYNDQERVNNTKCGVLVSHFLNEVKNNMHTLASFETFYGLKWIYQNLQ